MYLEADEDSHQHRGLIKNPSRLVFTMCTQIHILHFCQYLIRRQRNARKDYIGPARREQISEVPEFDQRRKQEDLSPTDQTR